MISRSCRRSPAAADRPTEVRTPVRLTFAGDVARVPVIYEIGQQFKVVTNIRRAQVQEDSGWLELDLEGEKDEIDKALEHCQTRGVTVQRL